MKSPLLTDLYMDKIKRNPTWHVDSFLATVESEWNHSCTKRKAYRALDRALKIIEGKHAEQYTKLWDFAEEVKKTNPGSTVKVKLDRGRFQRIYVCLGACKEGFKLGCMPLIGLDVCHLKSVYGELLAVDVRIVNQGGWTFISDQQNGLIPAFKKVLPNSHHRFCMRHLYTNFRNLFKGKTLKDALWSVARTTTVPYFKKAMEDMKKLDEKAYDWLVKLPAHHWSKSHFETHPKCDMLLNNLCESFNAVILIPRQKPIVTMLLLIHTLLIKRIQMRKDIMVNKVGDLCPKIKKKLEEAKIQSGDALHNGIPCNHAISAINFKREKPEDYVDAYYSKARYLEVYSHLVMSMNEMSLWEETDKPPIVPPTYTRQPGRPMKKRNNEAAERDNEGDKLPQTQPIILKALLSHLS
ncbi:uncharacterized protein [Malus domestica]|uniref:uncharacterized protein n=1 Tax=Malus domestica TaxID=3750 RepID=UPI0010A9CFC7|nr:uncharacterized protein LOC103421671 [Malus domestica]